jgi:hypothetical protein
MGSCFGFFGCSPLPGLTAYARTGRSLVRTQASVDPLSAWARANPPVLTNDYAAYETNTEPSGYVLTLPANGLASYQGFGDTSRQSFLVDHYSRRYLHRFTGDARRYTNNRSPTAPDQTLLLTVGVFFQPFDYKTVFANPENDPLTGGLSDGAIPDGMTLAGTVLSGTPIVPGVGLFKITVSDGLSEGHVFVTWTVFPSSTGTTAGALTADIRVKSVVGGGLVRSE